MADSTRRTLDLGAAGATTGLLATYNDETLVIGPLLGDNKGGLRWAYNWSISPYFESPDCSGPGYFATGSVGGAKYFGTAFQESGKQYIYIGQATLQSVTLRSLDDFAGSTCSLLNQPLSTSASPIVAVVPASTYGVEPFTLK